MIEKVKLDLLTDLEATTVEEVADVEKEVSDLQEKPARWYTSRQFLLLTLLGVTILAISLSVLGTFLWIKDQKEKAAARERREAEAQLARTPTVVNLNDFMINIKDSKGNLRILACDVALQFAPNRASAGADKRVDIRNIIYVVAKGRTTDWWKSTEESHNLKKEISDRLNTLLGAGTVTEVNFTKLEVL
jgi:flagellar basal body-associated protein FliL